ncbi:MAG: glutamine amidotransferase [Desulfotomaculaceae bacterium]|nr:glutamine amidotransferase [Desulfotomaculaceae bacterium]
MLQVGHLYPELLNLYGDRGNIITFVQRCRWRNIPVSVRAINLGEPVNFKDYDFVLLGGGSDREQNLIAADLLKHRDEFAAAIEDGLVVLAICGGYQLLGKYYLTLDHENIPGLDILDFYTRAGDKRLVGNVAVEVNMGGKKFSIAGFENHSGQTYLGNIQPLGRILAGGGNNGVDGLEGARYKNVFCSYLHGPLLPKNARLTDQLITLALARRGIKPELMPLDDRFENSACQVMLDKLRVSKG